MTAPGGARAEATAEGVVAVLVERGDLWRHAPGLVGLRGDALRLFRALEMRLAALAGEETSDEWRVPEGVTLDTLACADTFTSFPGWLTVASHLGGDADTLEAVARAEDPAAEARSRLAPAAAALPPAVCYHAYAALAGTTLPAPRTLTAQGTCWRHEGDRLAPLERGWAFTMREVVRLGPEDDVEDFRARGVRRAVELALDLGLRPSVEAATDPFFAPTARGRQMLQRLKGAKHELILPVGGGRRVAAASFNHHGRFFGEAFGIVHAGGPTHSGCVAFGLERWLLAVLVEHGDVATALRKVEATHRVATDVPATAARPEPAGEPTWTA